MIRKMFIPLFWSLNLFAGGGTLFITNHSKEPVTVNCSIISITGKEISTHIRVPHQGKAPINWPSIQDLFPRETLRGIIFHVKIELYDDNHHLLNRSQITHIFHRNPNDYEIQEVNADLDVEIRGDYGIRTQVGKIR